KEIRYVCSCVCHIYSDVEPLSGFGPANIEQVCRRNNLVEGVVVNRIWLAVQLRVGSILSLVDTKFVEVGPISRVQLSAAVVLWIGVVIRDSFAAQVVVSAQYLSGYFLRTALIAAVVIRQSLYWLKNDWENAIAGSIDTATKHKENALRLILSS